MIRIDVGSLPEGPSHLDIEEDASELEIDAPGARFASPVAVALDLTRNGDEIFASGEVAASVVFECSRCLEECECKVRGQLDLILLVGQGKRGEDQVQSESLLRVPAGQKYADITDAVRSEVLLRFPLKPLCRDDCKGLCPECGANLNVKQCSCRAVGHDTRWDALKRFKQR